MKNKASMIQNLIINRIWANINDQVNDKVIKHVNDHVFSKVMFQFRKLTILYEDIK